MATRPGPVSPLCVPIDDRVRAAHRLLTGEGMQPSTFHPSRVLIATHVVKLTKSSHPRWRRMWKIPMSGRAHQEAQQNTYGCMGYDHLYVPTDISQTLLPYLLLSSPPAGH